MFHWHYQSSSMARHLDPLPADVNERVFSRCSDGVPCLETSSNVALLQYNNIYYNKGITCILVSFLMLYNVWLFFKFQYVILWDFILKLWKQHNKFVWMQSMIPNLTACVWISNAELALTLFLLHLLARGQAVSMLTGPEHRNWNKKGQSNPIIPVLKLNIREIM